SITEPSRQAISSAQYSHNFSQFKLANICLIVTTQPPLQESGGGVNLRRRDVRQSRDESLACAWWTGNYEGDKRWWLPQEYENSQRSFAAPSSSEYLVPPNYYRKAQ